ncbi:MAG: LacI family transcriptional regulator [Firmicutes bacterium HGW-Firmicutes-3]|jgi:simple sugar transport system substrate-binding protein|nr:MAG: LacI family transcriptional regulator [Firmicutes bacterium HGW-Firmicutes-3]
MVNVVKKLVFMGFVFTLVTGLILGLSGCTSKSESNEETATKTEESTSKITEEKILEVVFVPKITGIPWFNAMEKGMKDYAKEFGGLNISVSGPAEADPLQQVKALEDVIARKPDVIVVVPNDTQVLEPVLEKARAAGILVISQEASSIENADADIEFLFIDRVGQQYMDALAKGMGEKGGYAIMVGGLTVENHNARADAAIAYQKENYPDMYEVTSRVEGSEDVSQAHDTTLELIKAHEDLGGMIYIGTNGPIGAATAIQEKNLIGKFVVVGTAVPSQAKPFIEDGSITSAIIGSPYNIGYVTSYVVKTLSENGMDISSITEVPIYGETVADGKVITFHADSEVTLENIDSFGF